MHGGIVTSNDVTCQVVRFLCDRMHTQLTIDELAREAGMTVRNVRAHQSRGLLPPPEIRGRTGYYGTEHVDRLELIKDLQAEGFSLELIKRILDRAPGTTAAEILEVHARRRRAVRRRAAGGGRAERAGRALGRPAHAEARRARAEARLRAAGGRRPLRGPEPAAAGRLGGARASSGSRSRRRST